MSFPLRIAVSLGLAVSLGAPAAAGAQEPLVPAPTTALSYAAKVVVPTLARSEPAGGKVVAKLATSAPLYGGPTVLLVLGSDRRDGNVWLDVRLPSRPNTAHGWVRADDTLVRANRHRVRVDISARTVTVLRAGRRVAGARAVVGARRTPTPTGLHAITETVPQPSGSKLGSWVVALSAHSDVHRTFAGGDGRVGVHGYERLGDPLGSMRSNGCVRIPRGLLARVAKLPAGTPVSVQR